VLYYPVKQAESPFPQQKKTIKQRLKHVETRIETLNEKRIEHIPAGILHTTAAMHMQHR